jgi:selenide,water dikinase
VKRLLLAGGGHSHLFVLAALARARPAGVEVVLASPDRRTPYSGMVPGVIAGHYPAEACVVDLVPLARTAGARFIEQPLVALDAAARGARLADGSTREFDLASLDIGSAPAGLHGAPWRDTVIPVKPFPAFIGGWRAASEAFVGLARPPEIAVVGAGAAGIEVALAIEYRLRALRARVCLVTDAATIAPALGDGGRRRLAHALARRGVEVRTKARVLAVSVAGDRRRLVVAEAEPVEVDHVVWATGASAAPWLRETGLALDGAGFVAISDTFASVSHPQVYAAGDCATMVDHPRPKAGVYAVRQGEPLARNLLAALAGAAPRRFRPQRAALALISTGGRTAIAARGRWAFGGERSESLLWRWKDRIDRRFMARFAA